MLKFKLNISNANTDKQILDVTHKEIIDSTRYDIVGSLSAVNTYFNERNLVVSVKDIMGIQDGSHLIGINKISVYNEDAKSVKVYDYVDDLVVDSVSKANNSFSVKIDKDLVLKVNEVGIETRYKAFQFINNNWEIFDVTKEWLIDNEVYDKDGAFVSSNTAAYGKNGRQIAHNGVMVDVYNVYYYENASWKIVELINADNMEGCLNGNKFDFYSFHKYDVKDDVVDTGGVLDNHNLRDALKMEEEKIYYTRENYVYFNCNGAHYFTAPKEIYDEIDDEENGICYVKTTDYGKDVILNKVYPNVRFSYERVTEDGINYTEHVDIECHIDDDSHLSFDYDKLKEKVKSEGREWFIGEFENMIFTNGIDIDTNDDNNDYLGQSDGNTGAFKVTRDNIMYNDEYTLSEFVYDSSINTVQIPISQKFETDMYHNDAISGYFAEVQRKNAVNPIMDLEKDVYTPAIYVGNTSNGIYNHMNADYVDCEKIIFNLHFREHRDRGGDKWACEKESYWNGTKKIEKEIKVKRGGKEVEEKKNIVDLQGRVFQYENDEQKTEKYDYFSYFGVKPGEDSGYDSETDYALTEGTYQNKRKLRNQLKELQSDTLAYLGFSNNDVKYQKSKLKKSFLRISFYDSDNIGNQNLLHTATIFLDSGGLFAKYIRNIETENFYEVIKGFKGEDGIRYKNGEIIEEKIYNRLGFNNQENCRIYGNPCAVTGSSTLENIPFTGYDTSGVRVNREPMRLNEIKESSNLEESVNSFEELRMSSQIEVTDKFSSNKSSEGFYFYTYKSNDVGVYPSEIYMRVEFNHAGYGRTIPFMMPYIRKNEEKLTEGQAGYERYTINTVKDRKNNKIKTFDDICYDWSEIDYDKSLETLKEEDEIGYGTLRYMKYAYIKWKYRYDKHTQKHIYYLDPDVYGTGVTTSNNQGRNIILNLYEGKIR